MSLKVITIRGAFLAPGRITSTASLTAEGDTNEENNRSTVNSKVTGQACTLVGTFGNDKLTGTRASDVVCGLAGDDTIDIRGGATDTAYGNEGNDCFLKDRVDATVGGPGKDTPE